MGEIRIVGPGKTRGYPYPVCKKFISRFSIFLLSSYVRMQTVFSNCNVIFIHIGIYKARIIQSYTDLL